MVEQVVFRLSLDTSSTYDGCEVPPLVLALDTWVSDKQRQDRPGTRQLQGAGAGGVFDEGRAAQGPLPGLKHQPG